MIQLIKINDDVIVNPEEVCSVERQVVEKYSSASISDSSTYVEFDGSVMTLKNGRKIYVRRLVPNEILVKLQTGKPFEVKDDEAQMK